MKAQRRALIAYALLAVVTTYPLVLNFTTHVAGTEFDAPALTWNLWWIKFSIFDQAANPLFANYIFYPIGIDLVAYTLTLFNGFLSLPLQFNWGVIVANNVIVLLELLST